MTLRVPSSAQSSSGSAVSPARQLSLAVGAGLWFKVYALPPLILVHGKAVPCSPRGGSRAKVAGL